MSAENPFITQQAQGLTFARDTLVRELEGKSLIGDPRVGSIISAVDSRLQWLLQDPQGRYREFHGKLAKETAIEVGSLIDTISTDKREVAREIAIILLTSRVGNRGTSISADLMLFGLDQSSEVVREETERLREIYEKERIKREEEQRQERRIQLKEAREATKDRYIPDLYPYYMDERFMDEFGYRSRTVYIAPGERPREHGRTEMVDGLDYVYDDRLYSWFKSEDVEEAKTAASKKVGEENRSTVRYFEEVLKALFKDPDLEILHILSGVNGRGYPFQVFGFLKSDKQ